MITITGSSAATAGPSSIAVRARTAALSHARRSPRRVVIERLSPPLIASVPLGTCPTARRDRPRSLGLTDHRRDNRAGTPCPAISSVPPPCPHHRYRPP